MFSFLVTVFQVFINYFSRFKVYESLLQIDCIFDEINKQNFTKHKNSTINSKHILFSRISNKNDLNGNNNITKSPLKLTNSNKIVTSAITKANGNIRSNKIIKELNRNNNYNFTIFNIVKLKLCYSRSIEADRLRLVEEKLSYFLDYTEIINSIQEFKNYKFISNNKDTMLNNQENFQLKSLYNSSNRPLKKNTMKIRLLTQTM